MARPFFEGLSVLGGSICVMPPRRRSAAVPLDVELTRQKLAEGKIVRVGISRSAQFPEGAIGRVRGIGDPAVDGEEYVHVELNLGGTRDVLPFAPADLTPATRAKPATAQARQPAGPVRQPAAAPVRHLPVEQLSAFTGTEAPPAGRGTPGGSGVTGKPNSADSGPGQRPSQPPPAPPGGGREATAPVTSAAKQPRTAKRPPPVTITIATSESEPTAWRIEARVGARVALRSGAVSPARVWDLVQGLENETLIKAVGSILTEQRNAASARAEALAAELAAVRAELSALPDAGAS